MLEKLELVKAPKDQVDPFEKAKTMLLKRLDDQLDGVTKMVNGKPSALKERQKWYYKINDVMYFKVKVQNRPLVFKEDLDRIVIGEDKNAPKVVQQVIEAVQNGELDELIQEAIAK